MQSRKRRALSPTSLQRDQVATLMTNPSAAAAALRESPQRAERKHLIPDFVARTQGSSAGAGSGEFHVYKAARRREQERLQAMQDEVDETRAKEEFERKRSELQAMDSAKTARNRLRRLKKKKNITEKAGSRTNKDMDVSTSNTTLPRNEKISSSELDCEATSTLAAANISKNESGTPGTLQNKERAPQEIEHSMEKQRDQDLGTIEASDASKDESGSRNILQDDSLEKQTYEHLASQQGQNFSHSSPPTA